MKKIVMLIGLLLIALSLISCGGGGISDSVNGSGYTWNDEEIDTINTNSSNLGVKYSSTNNYDFQYEIYKTSDCDYTAIIAKKNTNFTTTLYSQTYTIYKVGNSKYELHTNGTTTTYTSLQTAFSVIYTFS